MEFKTSKAAGFRGRSNFDYCILNCLTMPPRPMRTTKLFIAIVFLACAASAQNSPLATKIQQVLDRPEFRHASFGIEFYDLDARAPIYRLNGDKLFTPASTTKLLTEGTAL